MTTSSRVLVWLASLSLACPATAIAVELGEYWGSQSSFEGLLQADAIWFDDDRSDLGGGSDDRATGLRRAELVLKGKGPASLDWVLGYDARADRWLDVNARIGLAGGKLQLGQFKQPNSLEELSSTRNNDFIAKAAATNTFAVSRRLGVGWAQAGQLWTATASVFGREITGGGAQGSGVALRGTLAPLQGDRGLLHLGASFVSRDTDADLLRLRVRPQADLAGRRLLDTGSFHDADRVSVGGLEAAWLLRGLKLQGEFLRADVDRLASPGFTGHGGYLSALWNLGGSGWGYKGGLPTLSLPEPGASLWQLGLRWDRLDLDDGAVEGGEMDAITAGVNWYRGQHLKAMINLVDVQSTRAGLEDDPDLVELRLQWHW